ncbi:multicopper oxidase domain-containing protein [Miltoncostaea marina]|uniref:multicopper oxidase domain-containing protein n=1 Tax=Miltoncostaea marina TaxID=2843215 RepID=UPI001C3D205E|nr:multicopper oxidase domain-containing protein [Miltoncostaea marina]
MPNGFTRRQVIGGLAVGGPLAALGLTACGGGDDGGAAVAAGTALPTDHAMPQEADFDPGPPVKPREPHTIFPAEAPPRSTTRRHEIVFEVDEHLREVAPGRTMMAWTFNIPGQPGRVPGPVLRVTEGDRIDFTLRNTGSLQHSMDFHAAKISWSRHYQAVDVGEETSFSFIAKVPGVFMWHCGVPPVLLHVGQGQHGMIIVDPKDESLLPPAREFALCQTDLYAGKNGEISDYAKLQAGSPEFVVFNGYANQYTGGDALRIKKGERVRVFVQNAGPSRWSAFHVIGALFDRVFAEGIHKENLTRGSQTVNLAPSQGAVVEFTVEEEGSYPS